MPGQVRTYFFNVPEDYGPTKIDPQCITSTYQSFVDFSRDMYSGLVGPLLICKRGSLDGYGRQVRYSHTLCKQYMKNQKFLSKYISPIVTFQIVYLFFFFFQKFLVVVIKSCHLRNLTRFVCSFLITLLYSLMKPILFVQTTKEIIVIFKTLTNRVLIVLC